MLGFVPQPNLRFSLTEQYWMLPGLSGLEICRRLRSIVDQVPIILLTVK
jgi:DNA-binding response OmpR family regulator